MTAKKCKMIFCRIGLILLSTVFLGACSESDSKPEASIPLVKPVVFPYIFDNALYEFDPVSGETELLIESNKALMIALDTDRSISTSDENNTNYRAHSSLPEYVAYAIDQTLWLYDLESRKNHALFTFPAIKGENQALYDTYSFICDIQKVVTIDADSFEDKTLLFKDEKSIYVKTSTTESCDGSPSEFIYSRILITDSPKDTFSIRQQKLLKHTHASDHEHDENHAHVGDHKKDEGNFHEHEHKHDIGNNHEHGHIHGEGHEAEHLLDKNLETVTVTLPVKTGKLRQASEALMYAGTPIVDTENKQFGYLGFGWDESSAQNTYTFFVANNSDLRKDEITKSALWSLSSDDFSSTPVQTSAEISDQLFPALNRSTNHIRLSNSLLIEHNWKVFRLEYAHFFDRNMASQRASSINNPVFIRTPDTSAEPVYTPADLVISETDHTLFVVKDQNKLYSVDNSGETKLIREMSDTGLTSFNFKLIKNHIIAIKHYGDETAITAISYSGGPENTLRAKTLNKISIKQISDDLYISEEEYESYWRSELILYKTNLDAYAAEPIADTLWNATYNGSTASQITRSESTAYPSIITDYSNLATSDYLAISFPVNVHEALGVFIFDSHYGYTKIKQSANGPVQVYYFDPSVDDTLLFMFEEATD